MDNKDNFHTFISENFVRFSGEQDICEWLDQTEDKFNELCIVRSLRLRAIPMLIEGDIELKYIQVREYIRTFDDFYVFLLSLYDPEFSTSEEAQFYLKLLGNSSDTEHKHFAEYDNCQTKSIDNNEFSSESVITCSLPFEEKFVSIVTDNISSEESSVPCISVDNTTILSNSLDPIGSEKQIIAPSSNIVMNIGAANILGVTPAEKLPTFHTKHVSVVLDKARKNHFKVHDRCLKKKLKSTRTNICLLESTRYNNHALKLFNISNPYQLDSIFDALRTSVLRRYIQNRVKHSVRSTILYKKRKKYIEHLSTDTFRKTATSIA